MRDIVLLWAPTVVIWVCGIVSLIMLRRSLLVRKRVLREYRELQALIRTVPDPSSEEWGDQQALLDRCIAQIYFHPARLN